MNPAKNLEEVIASNTFVFGLGHRAGMMMSRGAVITNAAANGAGWSERPYYFCKSPLRTPASSHLPPAPLRPRFAHADVWRAFCGELLPVCRRHCLAVAVLLLQLDRRTLSRLQDPAAELRE